MFKIKIEELIQKINSRDIDKNLPGSAYVFAQPASAERSADGSASGEQMNADDERQYLEMTISSETPIEDWFGYLILDHSEQALVADRLKTGASFRDMHYGDQVGIISSYSFTDTRKLKIGINFSPHNPRAVMLYKEYRDRLRKNSSVRFIIHELKLERTVDNTDYYRAIKWEFVHGAAVPDGADNNVGMDRNFNKNIYQLNQRSSIVKTPEETAAEEKAKELERAAAEKAAQLAIKQERDQEVKIAIARAKVSLKTEQGNLLDRVFEKGGPDQALSAISIFTMARDYQKEFGDDINLTELADKYVAIGTSDRKFGDMITDLLALKSQRAVSGTLDGLDKKDRQAFSIAKLIDACAPDSKVNIDRELGMIKEYEQQNNISLVGKRGGRVIPYAMLYDKARTLITSTPTSAGNLVATNLIASEFIPLARNKAIVDQLGIRIFPNLVGNQAIPTQTATANGSWMTDEVTPPSASDLTTGQKTLTPRTFKVKAAFSRLAAMNTTPGIEQVAVDDLLNVVALARDKSVHHGAGSVSSEPTGIIATAGVGLGTVKTSWTFADIVAMETSAAAANLDVASSAYVTTATIRGTLKTTEKSLNYPLMLWENNQMNGYQAKVTNQITAGHIFFGDYSQVILGEWGGIELVYNPYTYDGAIMQVSAYLTMDVVVRYALAFSYYKPV